MFGNVETLLYIGRTDVNFLSRIKSHQNNWINEYRGQIYVRLGGIVFPKIYDDEMLDNAESSLIYETKPPHNIYKKNSYTYNKEYEIYNLGYRGILNPIISMYEQE